jgi:hypothetical protein
VNHAKWGTWVASPFLTQTGVLGNPFSIGLVGLIASPGAGLVAFSPLTLLAPWLLADFARRRRAECAAVVAIGLSFWLLGGSFPAWTGLWSAPGPRYLYPLTPLLLLPLGPWLDAHPRGAWRRAVIVLAVLGAIAQLAVLGAEWSAVIAREHYLEWEPPKGFVWSFTAGPIPASLRAIADGWLGPWLWTIAKGWPGRAGTPGLALLLLAVWAVAFGAACVKLRRLVAAPPEVAS